MKKIILLSILLFAYLFSLHCQGLEKCTPLPEKMVPAVVSCNNRIYAIRNADFYRGNLTSPSFMYEYDPEDGSWIKKGQMNHCRTYFGLTVINDRIFALGGVLMDGTSTAAVEEYDILSGKWELKKGMPLPLRGMAIVPSGESLYILGGSVRSKAGSVFRDSSCTSFFEYDIRSDSWKIKASMSRPRTWLAAERIKNKIYAIGGNNSFSQSGENTIEEYNFRTNEWSVVSQLILPFDGQCQSKAWNKKVLTFSSDLSAEGKLSGAIIGIYDPASKKWTEKATMILPIMDFGTLLFNDKIYLIGGHQITGGYSDKIMIYDPKSDSQNNLTELSQWMNGIAELEGYLYLVGGVNSKGFFIDRVARFKLTDMK